VLTLFVFVRGAGSCLIYVICVRRGSSCLIYVICVCRRAHVVLTLFVSVEELLSYLHYLCS
jgi:hypothetical protein